MNVRKFIKLAIGFSIIFSSVSLLAEWKIDLSRRAREIGVDKYVEVIPKEEKKEVFQYYYSNKHPIQELVIMSTEKGFVPESVSLKAGVQYRIHLVNVNKQEQNTSFVMASFSQYHSMFYGRTKSFILHPKKEGIYKFESPETDYIGKLIVHSSEKKQANSETHIDLERGLASEGN